MRGKGIFSEEVVNRFLLGTPQDQLPGGRGTARKLPQPVKWLSDNKSCYRAYETIEFAMRLG